MTNMAGQSRRPAVEVVPPEVSLRRSRIGWWVPIYGMPVLLALSAVLAGTKASPPGIGVIALFWAFLQIIWVGGGTVTKRNQLPRVDQEKMIITGRSWTGHRTLDLARLSRVQRVKWTFRGEYGGTDRVDYVTLVDQAGVHLSMPRWAAVQPVQLAMSGPGRNQVKVSKFAAMGLNLAPNDLRFRLARTLLLLAGTCAYGALVCTLMVVWIPALAGYHGG